MSTIGYVLGFLILGALCVYIGYYIVTFIGLARAGFFNGALLGLMDTGTVLATIFVFWMLVFGRKKK